MKLINADCIEAMKAMPDNSVDSIVTDPPYELGFMGKSWDASGIAFNIEVWQEALRVIKPGGHLIAFSGSRTYHRMAVAIEDAGFQIRDQIMWVYGSGFPKSHNISKGIDKALDFEGEVIGTEKIDIGIQGGSMHSGRQTNVVEREIVELSPDAVKWQGWGTALKPAHEPMVLARKPLEGTVANNVLTHGTGGLNIDGTRVVADGENFDNLKSRPIGKLNTRRNGETDEEFDARVGESPEQLAALAKLKELGRFPANFIHDGSDEVVALFPDTGSAKAARNGPRGGKVLHDGGWDKSLEGFWPADTGGSAARFFYCAKASKRDRNEGLDGFEKVVTGSFEGNADISNARKIGDQPSKPNLPRANHHPTVKPTSLMQYLIRLVTPPNGIVLDPFMGSGSTGKACAYEGFDFIGIEQSAEYVAIAQARIDFAVADKSNELPL
jgi:site-specific DNA-methyltransferase (adenine-specific)